MTEHNDSTNAPDEKTDTTGLRRDLIAGVFMIIAALTGSITTWYNPFASDESGQSSTAQGNAGAVIEDKVSDPVAGIDVTALAEQIEQRAARRHQTVPVRAVSSSQPTAQDLLLNFQLFQNSVTHGDLTLNQETTTIGRLTGGTVIWHGYVRSCNPTTSETGEALIIVSLCETEEKLTQSMFYTPAVFHCASTPDLESLQPGQKATLSGRFEQHSKVATIITNAVLIGTD